MLKKEVTENRIKLKSKSNGIFCSISAKKTEGCGQCKREMFVS